MTPFMSKMSSQSQRSRRWEHFPALATALTFSLLTVCNEIAFSLVASALADLPQHKPTVNPQLLRYRLSIHLCTALALACVVVALRHKQGQIKAERITIKSLEQERASLENVVAMRTVRLSELATHLQDARETERRHLARELHDEMGAMFTTAKLDVARIRGRFKDLPSEVQARLDHLAQTLDTGIFLKRQIIEELRPSSLANLGLTTTLETYLQELAARSALQIRYFIDSPTLSERGELTVFRLVQESLNNVIKHANAQQVVVTVRQIDSDVRVEIHDDGIGFDRANTRPNTHGLHGMAHRVEVPGGQFKIHSRPGGGTVVTASFPISMK
jgi:signal transduction histidine kinase